MEIKDHKLSNADSDAISFKEAVLLIWDQKILIIFSTFLFTFLFAIFTLFLTNIYTSSAVLMPSKKLNSSSISGSGIGGLASLAGINLPASEEEKDIIHSIETLTSLDFFEVLYSDENFLIELYAIKKISGESYTLDEKIYKNNKWVGEFRNGSPKPSIFEAHQEFNEKHLKFFYDQKTSLVDISIDHRSPYVANNWLKRVVEELNFFLMKRAKVRAMESNQFLINELSKNSISEVRALIAGLMERNYKDLTMASVTNDYAFRYLDEPRIPDKRSKPARARMCIIFSFTSVILLSIAIILLRLANKQISFSIRPFNLHLKEI